MAFFDIKAGQFCGLREAQMSVEIQMNKIKRKLLSDKIHGQLQSLSLILFWKGSIALAYRLIKIFSFVMLHVPRKTTLRWKVTKLTCTVCVKLLSLLLLRKVVYVRLSQIADRNTFLWILL